MLRDPALKQYPFEMETLEERGPEDHLVRHIDAAIDFEFIRDSVSHLYCADTDSTYVKADANPCKAVNEERPEGVSEYLEQLKIS